MVLTKIKELFSLIKKKPIYEASVLYDEDCLEDKLYFDTLEGAEEFLASFTD